MAELLVASYFHEGYSNKEILLLLNLNNHIDISYRQLKRIMRQLNLKRRRNFNLRLAMAAIKEEIKLSGQTLGYRIMQRRLMLKYGISVGRDSVAALLKIIDPEGVQLRQSNCLTRRTYWNVGPNYLIHIDGYDKIKQFGFAIHGAMCGFSRRVLWLRVARTNNDPSVVASYFLEYIKEINGVPRCLRIDAGTENTVIEDIQKAFRWFDADSMSGEKSVIIGKSSLNQRIERWWRSLRQMGMSFWIDFFKDLELQGLVSTANPVHIECLRFCFMKIIQGELDQIRREWNHHPIRQQRYNTGGRCPSGKPEIIFSFPELYGSFDFKCPVANADIQHFQAICEYPRPFGCTQEIEERCIMLLHSTGRTEPNTIGEALDCFGWLAHRL